MRPVRPLRLLAVAMLALAVLAPPSLATAASPATTSVTSAPPYPAVSAATGEARVVRTVAGGVGRGPAREVDMTPVAIAVDGQERVLVVDSQHRLIRRIDSGMAEPLGAFPCDSCAAGTTGRLLVGLDGAFYAPDGPAAVTPDGLQVGATRVVRSADEGRTWTPYAGSGATGSSPDGTPAAQASLLDMPAWVSRAAALDSQGRLLLAEPGRVRRVEHDGRLSTLATITVNGTPGIPVALAGAPDGSVYVSDLSSCTVQRVLPDGTQRHVAGVVNREAPCPTWSRTDQPASRTPMPAPSQLAVTADGTLFLDRFEWGLHRLDAGADRLVRHEGVGISLFAPTGLAVSSTALHRALAVPRVVQTIDVRAPYASTVTAGTGDLFNGAQRTTGFGRSAVDAQLVLLHGLAAGPGGQLHFAGMDEPSSGGIPSSWSRYHVDQAGLLQWTLGSTPGGPTEGMPAASYGGGRGDMAVAPNGDLLLAIENAIWRRDADTATLHRVAGGGDRDAAAGEQLPAAEARLGAPSALHVAGGRLLFIDTGPRLKQLDLTTGLLTTLAGGGDPSTPDGGDGWLARDAAFTGVRAVTTDVRGGILVLDAEGTRLRRVSACGGVDTVWRGPPEGGLSDIVALPDGSLHAVGPFDVVRLTGPRSTERELALLRPDSGGPRFPPLSLEPAPGGHLYAPLRDTVVELAPAAGPAFPLPDDDCPELSGFEPVAPSRLLDTRVSTVDRPAGPMRADSSVSVQVTGRGGVPATGVSAVVLNITADQATADTYVTAWPSGADRPLASNLNLPPGVTTPNAVTVRVGDDGRVELYNAVGSVHLIADVAGWYGPDATQGLTPVAPTRLLDTRDTGGPVRPGNDVVIDVTDVPVDGGRLPADTTAVVLNVTATEPTTASYVTAYPAGTPRPLASNLNLLTGMTRANLVTVQVGPGGGVALHNAAGATHLIADVAGYYSAGGAKFVPVDPVRLLDTREPETAGQPAYPLGEQEVLELDTRQAGLPWPTRAVALNVTAVTPSAGTYLTVFPGDAQEVPLASNLNLDTGQILPNLVLGRLGADGTLGIYNDTGEVHVLADLAGFFVDP